MPVKNSGAAVTDRVLVPGAPVNSGSCLKPAARCALRSFPRLAGEECEVSQPHGAHSSRKHHCHVGPNGGEGRSDTLLVCVCVCKLLGWSFWFPSSFHLLVPLNRKIAAFETWPKVTSWALSVAFPPSPIHPSCPITEKNLFPTYFASLADSF